MDKMLTVVGLLRALAREYYERFKCTLTEMCESRNKDSVHLKKNCHPCVGSHTP